VAWLVEWAPTREVLACQVSFQCRHVEPFDVQPVAQKRLGESVRLGRERVGVRGFT
jgi:hypothetical protein